MLGKVKFVKYRKPYSIRIHSIKNHDMLLSILTPMSLNKPFVITEEMSEFADCLRSMIENYQK